VDSQTFWLQIISLVLVAASSIITLFIKGYLDERAAKRRREERIQDVRAERELELIKQDIAPIRNYVKHVASFAQHMVGYWQTKRFGDEESALKTLRIMNDSWDEAYVLDASVAPFVYSLDSDEILHLYKELHRIVTGIRLTISSMVAELDKQGNRTQESLIDKWVQQIVDAVPMADLEKAQQLSGELIKSLRKYVALLGEDNNEQ
jgi:hypothetical protein